MRLNHERSFFQKSQKLLTERALSEFHGGGLFRTFNSYSCNFNGGLRKRRTGYCLLRTPSLRGKQFLWFLKIDLLRFHRIYLLFDWSKLLSFFMCLLRINLPNLCPNMNHFDAVDFSECHSEEVISFFWRSVYLNLLSPKLYIFSWKHIVLLHSLRNKQEEMSKTNHRNIGQTLNTNGLSSSTKQVSRRVPMFWKISLSLLSGNASDYGR